jgi:solute carrier family 25 folate transporter 32
LVESRSLNFNSYYVFLASILSKSRNNLILAIASTITFPLLVIRTILQDSRGVGGIDIGSMIAVFRNIRYKYGIRGLYSGLKPDLLRILPSNSIVFLVY